MLNFSTLRTIQGFVVILVLLQGVPALGEDIDGARRDVAEMKYAKAQAALVEIARSSAGGEKQEALYLLAGLKTSASEAEIIYREVTAMDPASEWGTAAQVEVAKIRFALGNYREAAEVLGKCSACGKSEEASYFEGLSALMLKRYAQARGALDRVKSERYRSAAALALADVETGANNREEACRRYKAIARSAASPTAMYRHAECLEEQGDIGAALAIFHDIAETFEQTPEALLAGEKIEALRSAQIAEREPPDVANEKAADKALSETEASSFTLQFGSFHDRANAIKLASDIKKRLPGVRIDSDLVDRKEVHRVRFGYFKTRAEAEKKAEEISGEIGERCTVMALQ